MTDVFGLLDVRAAQFARLEAQAPWGIQFHGYRHIKLGAVLRGSCEVWAEGLDEPVLIEQGDCYLLGNGRPYWLRSGPDVPLTSSAEVFRNFVPGGTVRWGAAPDTVVVGCGFHFDEANAAVLLDVLPELVHVPAASRPAEPIRSSLRQLAAETASSGLGSQLITERLAHIVLVQVLRAHIAAKGNAGGAWLTALADPQIGQALELIHESPAMHWTVAELAAKVGLSRSGFFARFSNLVGMPPLEYVARWRIRSAARDLRGGTRKISSIASEWGYSSESAFSHAFKRIMGTSPGRYRAVARAGPGADASG
ncbi:AraC family transcriptional regulator [Actinacidiphila acidipaludis]|uniref:AraC family transcriptional regulator n=1 Tax=Actinacidiphila acidipaludis TaxID=2873382 RepID=A0ABS7QD23_9ACTN|nr:AraC family transcriptional regulator [Streptomyces acidipaludis]MBY8881080.1 AraC family transcriptional regulator [Streptomyces acidipaludis]